MWRKDLLNLKILKTCMITVIILGCLNLSGCTKEKLTIWRAEGGTQPDEVKEIMLEDYVVMTQEFFDEEFIQ